MPLRSAVLTIVLATLLAPAGAAAQAPPDEQAAARTFADAAGRFRTAVAGLGDRLAPDLAKSLARCPRVMAGLSGRDETVAGNQLALGILREFGVAITPALSALRTDLANVPTRDPALLSGRAAYRQIGRAYASLGAPTDICATLRAWRRAGRPRAAGRAAWRRLLPIKRIGRRAGAQAARGDAPDDRARRAEGRRSAVQRACCRRGLVDAGDALGERGPGEAGAGVLERPPRRGAGAPRGS